MRVHVSHPALMPDLVEFLSRALCRTAAVHGSVVDVTLPGAEEGPRARRSLDLYLAAWRGLHPRVETTVLDEPGSHR